MLVSFCKFFWRLFRGSFCRIFEGIVQGFFTGSPNPYVYRCTCSIMLSFILLSVDCKTRVKMKGPSRPPGSQQRLPDTLCVGVFLCILSVKAFENPNRSETSVRKNKQKTKAKETLCFLWNVFLDLWISTSSNCEKVWKLCLSFESTYKTPHQLLILALKHVNFMFCWMCLSIIWVSKSSIRRSYGSYVEGLKMTQKNYTF